MNYTENYQLNQWVESDRVLMEDFNSDNTKLDAALTELAARESWNLILQQTFSTQQTTATAFLASSVIIQQQLILIKVTLGGSGAALLTTNLSGRRFYVASNAWQEDGILQVSSTVPGWVLLPVGKTASGTMRGVGFGDTLYYSDTTINPGSFQNVNLKPTYGWQYVPAGTTVEVWGCK